MQKILAFSTIQNGISIIIQEKDIILYENFIKTEKQSELLVSNIEASLKINNLSYSDIDIFSTIVGSGNFTSIKTSVATLKALKLATKKRVITTNIFEIINHKINKKTVIIQQNPTKYYIMKDGDYFTVTSLDNLLNEDAVINIKTENKNFIFSEFSNKNWAELNYEKLKCGNFTENIEALYIEPPKVTCRKK